MQLAPLQIEPEEAIILGHHSHDVCPEEIGRLAGCITTTVQRYLRRAETKRFKIQKNVAGKLTFRDCRHIAQHGLRSRKPAENIGR